MFKTILILVYIKLNSCAQIKFELLLLYKKKKILTFCDTKKIKNKKMIEINSDIEEYDFEGENDSESTGNNFPTTSATARNNRNTLVINDSDEEIEEIADTAEVELQENQQTGQSLNLNKLNLPPTAFNNDSTSMQIYRGLDLEPTQIDRVLRSVNELRTFETLHFIYIFFQ